MSGPHQTQKYLKELFARHGLRPKKQFGQNFLVDLNLLGVLTDAAALTPKDVVLEVGSGTAGLTTRLGALAGRVVTVEIDTGFQDLVAGEISHMPTVELVRGDALAGKNKMNPDVLAAVARAMAALPATGFHLVANLPYDVAPSVLGNLLVCDLPLRSATITVQAEVGDRIIAKPATPDYGPLSVLVQRLGTAYRVRNLPPSSFWPPPKVQSSIVRVEVDESRRAPPPELRACHRFVRDLFIHRRKTLRSAVASVPGCKAAKEHLDELLGRLGIAPETRAETLAPEQLGALHAGLRAMGAVTLPPDA